MTTKTGNIPPERIAKWRKAYASIIRSRKHGTISDISMRCALELIGFRGEALEIEMSEIDKQLKKGTTNDL